MTRSPEQTVKQNNRNKNKNANFFWMKRVRNPDIDQ